ncbi:MAG TPA: flagellar export chaperone FlgN [Anaerohalosphaeraceae bacterium]|jgi:flagellar biosynthesis/type III secretory pathway chaperone|nr:flagellar export chaperone FlgN [Anaerohalosphaeraceae bacterium]
MNALSQEHLDKLAEYLDSQAGYLERVLQFLDEFRKSLIRRDVAALEQMQEQMEQEGELCRQMEQRRRRLTEDLAEVMGCGVPEVCLSRICSWVEPAQQAELKKRQEHLKQLADRLRQQHLATELLVREYTRMNRRFLEVLTGQLEKGRMYDAHGRPEGTALSGLVSVKL